MGWFVKLKRARESNFVARFGESVALSLSIRALQLPEHGLFLRGES